MSVLGCEVKLQYSSGPRCSFATFTLKLLYGLKSLCYSWVFHTACWAFTLPVAFFTSNGLGFSAAFLLKTSFFLLLLSINSSGSPHPWPLIFSHIHPVNVDPFSVGFCRIVCVLEVMFSLYNLLCIIHV